MGGITEIATGAPGYSSVRPNSMAPLAQTLTLNGYSSAQFGKCHEVPVWETSPAGPFDAWPARGGGFEYFYGFIGGEANQWYPTLMRARHRSKNKKTPEQGYFLRHDRQDDQMDWATEVARTRQAVLRLRPVPHAPHHVPMDVDNKGKFDKGYDQIREETFARQKQLGVIPADSQLTPHNKEIPTWEEMPAAFKPVLAREMEVYAGFLEYTDHHVGRIVDSLEKLEILDDTLIYYIVGDNAASAEGRSTVVSTK